MQISRSNSNTCGAYKYDNKKEINNFTKNVKTVLVIDDEVALIEICEIMLERLGHKVFKANSGSEGLKLFEVYKNQIDLVISDMYIPEVEGQEVFDDFRKIDHDIKILLSSGGLSNSDEEEVINKGFNGFIRKPYSMKSLSEKMAELLI